MKSDICIIGVYFGKFDNYFNLWLESAAKNKTIDFLIITDQEIENIEKYKNIFVEKMSMDDLHRLIENKVGTKIYLKKPYKLCDFRPAFGEIFDEYLTEYKYWGHCDFDLIWGDIRSFLEENDYSSFDRFLDRGHLTLYKNEKKINSLYKTKLKGTVGYKTIFKNAHNYLFDEGNIIKKICLNNNIKEFNDRLCADIDVIYSRFRHAFEISDLTKNYNNQLFYYEDGHVFMSYEENGIIEEKEYIYIHLQKRKNLILDIKNSDSYYITNKGFFSKDNKKISVDDFKKYNMFEGNEKELIEKNRFEDSIKFSKFKSKILKNPIGKIFGNIYTSIKYKFK